MQAEIEGSTFRVVGLMSGTSLDGVDIAFCHFQEHPYGWGFEIDMAECFSYPQVWQEKLKSAHLLSPEKYTELDLDYGNYLGELVNEFLRKNVLKPDYISSHGHTITHNPSDKISLQAGNGAAIYQTTGIPVVCNFRQGDVENGGQGAPLVPIGDEYLFGEFDYCLNLGGIANISYKNEQDQRIAFDISPCNLILNSLANEVGLNYDIDGTLAQKGSLIPELLNELNSWSYYTKLPPKSLDKESLFNELLPIINKYSGLENKIHTCTEHIAFQIGSRLNSKNKSVLITGGGTHNKYLINRIKHYSSSELILPEVKLIDFKEALVFAFIGLLRVLNRTNILSSVTGAKGDSSGGDIYNS